jgi:chromate transport protein ChrA
MNLSSPGVTYAFLIVPSAFALVVVFQGIDKISHGKSDGSVVLGFGIVFCLLIAAAYFLFIR